MRRLTLLLCTLASPWGAHASPAYGSLNNFDVVNDSNHKCYGFEIELDDVHSTDITYTYDYNHYGAPKITEDNSDPAHPKVFVRYESKLNPDGTFASFTNPQDPLHPLAPTDGHAFTDPSVNLGGEHFGVGFYGNPTLVKYNWLEEDPGNPGRLIHGPAVNVATPQFNYIQPAPGQVAAVVQAAIEPPEPPEPVPGQFGVPVWVKIYKTVQPSGHHIKLEELMTDDPKKPNDAHWAGDEQPETEIEWKVFQKRPADNPGTNEKIEAEDSLPNGDEMVTRRYEFYAYVGEVNPEDGEAKCSNIKKCPDAVGGYIGAQMAGFDVLTPLGLIEHLQDGKMFEDYVARTVVVGGNTPYAASVSQGTLPAGLVLDSATGVLSGTPTESGTFALTISATDADGTKVSKAFTLQIEAEIPEPPVMEIQLDDGKIKISVSGTSGSRWHIESATSLNGPWQTVGQDLVLPPEGRSELIEEATRPAAYYRAVSN